jgi:hypothetical protein
MFFWNGNSQRYIYCPEKPVKKISQGFYYNIPEEAFELLFFTKGVYDLEKISYKMHKLFGEKQGFSSINESLDSVNSIINTYKDARIII